MANTIAQIQSLLDTQIQKYPDAATNPTDRAKLVADILAIMNGTFYEPTTTNTN